MAMKTLWVSCCVCFLLAVSVPTVGRSGAHDGRRGSVPSDVRSTSRLVVFGTRPRIISDEEYYSILSAVKNRWEMNNRGKRVLRIVSNVPPVMLDGRVTGLFSVGATESVKIYYSTD